MNDATLEMRSPLSTRLLALLSASLFWCVPLSPFLSMAAVKATNKTTGWPRFVARTAAFLTIGWVTFLACGVAWILYVIVWNPAIA